MAKLDEDLINAENDLVANPALFKIFYGQAPIGVIIEDENEFLIANPHFSKLIGYSQEELRKLKIKDIVDPDDRAKYQGKIKQLLAKEIPFLKLEKRYRKKDGGVFIGNVSLGILKSNTGTEQLIAFIEDVSRQKESEQLIKNSEEQFRMLFEQSVIPMVFREVSADHYFITNLAFRKMLGYADEVYKKEKRSFFTAEENPQEIKKLSQQLMDGKISKFTSEKKYRHKDGHVIWVNVTRSLVEIFGKKSLLGIIENLSDIKLAMMEIQKSEQRYRMLFDNSYDGMILLDPVTLQLIKCNEAALRLFGFNNLEEFINQGRTLFMPNQKGKNSEEFFEDVFRKALSQKNYNYQAVCRRKDGELFEVDVTTIQYFKNGRTDLFFLIKDITSKIKAEEAQRNADLQKAQIERQQLELDNRNRELTSFTMFLQQKNRMLSDINDSLNEIKKESKSEELNSKLERIKRKIVKGTDDENDWRRFRLYFEQIHPDFFSKLRLQCEKLSLNELRHCAYIKMNLSQHEVADLLYVQPKTVEVARYRIKKKLGLSSKDNLLLFISTL